MRRFLDATLGRLVRAWYARLLRRDLARLHPDDPAAAVLRDALRRL